MGEATVTIPCEEYVRCVRMMAKIEAVQIMVQNGDVYCSDSIKKMLGIEVKNDAGTDRK